mmetsp:Transcript_17664/g.26138  ORF Transcript_17664/g.26138 Transcript_17664/m.26138 type:complete len:1263 (-) Transcript_17664:173-3961(-)
MMNSLSNQRRRLLLLLVIAASAAVSSVKAQEMDDWLTACPDDNPQVSSPCDFEGDCLYDPIQCDNGQAYGYDHKWSCINGEMVYAPVQVKCPGGGSATAAIMPITNSGGSDESNSPTNHASCPGVKPADGRVCEAIGEDPDGLAEDFADCQYYAVFCLPNMNVGGYEKYCECLYEKTSDEYEYHCYDVQVDCGGGGDDNSPVMSPVMDEAAPVQDDFTSLCDPSECDPLDYVPSPQDDEKKHVCGSNGVVYQNIGAVECANYCVAGQDEEGWIEVVDKTVCLPIAATTSSPSCNVQDCEHPDLLAPVCGSDGVTYRNEKVLQCANYCETDEDLSNHVSLQEYGPCDMDNNNSIIIDDDCSIQDCTHPENLEPVCGSDGVTYQNVDSLNCQNYCVPDTVHVAKWGACGGSTYTKPPPTTTNNNNNNSADPNNDAVCPMNVPQNGDSCEYGTTDMMADCLYGPLYCPASDNNLMHLQGYKTVCECHDYDNNNGINNNNNNDVGGGPVYVCTFDEEMMICPSKTTFEADPENDPNCPAILPQSGTSACATYQAHENCLYQPVFCDGSTDDGDNIHGYQKFCSCIDGIDSNTMVYQCDELIVTCPSNDDDDCDINDCIHTEEYDPVCGTDGETYENAGALECENYCTTTTIRVELASKGPCDNDDEYYDDIDDGTTIADPNNEFQCPKEPPVNDEKCAIDEDVSCLYEPLICGSNTNGGGVPYTYAYNLECSCSSTSQQGDAGLYNYYQCLVLDERCPYDNNSNNNNNNDDDDCDCVHVGSYAPVCGTDGITYDNLSDLNCNNYCNTDDDGNNNKVHVDYKGACSTTTIITVGKNVDDVPDPLNDPACPSTLPDEDSNNRIVCGGNGEDENIDCEYQPKYCDNGLIYGYQKRCACIADTIDGSNNNMMMNTGGNTGTYECYSQSVSCPTTSTTTVVVPSPTVVPAAADGTIVELGGNNNNHSGNPYNPVGCPKTMPNNNNDDDEICSTIFEIGGDLGCYYQPVTCNDPKNEVYGYGIKCSCKNNNNNNGDDDLKFTCVNELVACPEIKDTTATTPSPAAQQPTGPKPLVPPFHSVCPKDKPSDGDLCQLNNSNNKSSCRYTPFSCSDSMEITFRDVCTCGTDGTFSCTTTDTTTVSTNCHNTVVNPKCPLLTPVEQEICTSSLSTQGGGRQDGDDTDAGSSSSLVCGYDPTGCPENSSDTAMFLSTCECVNDEFVCQHLPEPICEYHTTDNGDNTNNNASSSAAATMMMMMASSMMSSIVVVVLLL